MRSRRFRSAGWLVLSVAALGAVLASRPGAPVGRTRTYYIAADPVAWDYVAGGRDQIATSPSPIRRSSAMGSPTGREIVPEGAVPRVHRQHVQTLKPRPAGVGAPGFPRARRPRASWATPSGWSSATTASSPYSVHPHGVFYKKDSEGAPYNDGKSAPTRPDDGVPPGGTHLYVWPVPERPVPARAKAAR